MTLMKSLAVLMAATTAMPALAVQYDAYTAFNGTNGAGGFTYGYSDGITGTAFDTLATDGGCAYSFAPGTCLYAGALGNIPTVEKGGTYPTVAPSGARLKLHPGNSGTQSVFATFTAPVAGFYSYNISLESIGTDTTNGVGVTFYKLFSGSTDIGARQVITFGQTASTSGKVFLNSNESIGALLDYNGNYGGDSTALSFQAGVPEPASWAMMALGFGLIGMGARRRRGIAAAA